MGVDSETPTKGSGSSANSGSVEISDGGPLESVEEKNDSLESPDRESGANLDPTDSGASGSAKPETNSESLNLKVGSTAGSLTPGEDGPNLNFESHSPKSESYPSKMEPYAPEEDSYSMKAELPGGDEGPSKSINYLKSKIGFLGFVDSLDSAVDISLDNILPQTTTSIHITSSLPDRIYPEYLLHQSLKGNKYYTALQKYSRQFIDDDQNNITQFTHTNLSQLMANTISDWDETEPETVRLEEKNPLRHSRANAASSLFSWSSGDKYIAARKLELKRKNENKNSQVDGSQSPTKEASPAPPSTPRSKFSSSQRLHSMVEKESNKFIQDRIEVIKAHHMKKASERISQRKRDDHEMHLRRLKLKEEKYAKALKAAIASQNTRRNTGFFGSLFGSKPISNSFTLDLLDSDPYVAAPASTKDSTTQLFPSQPSTSSPSGLASLESMKNGLESPDYSSPENNSSKQIAYTPDVLDESPLDADMIFEASANASPGAPTRSEASDLLVL